MVDEKTNFGGMLTALGAAKKTNCDALGIPWEPKYMLIGDANGTDPVPSPTQTKLINQVYRAQLNQLRVSPTDPNVLIAELVLPPDVGGWWVRELALEDKDGVFCAVGNAAPSYKPLLTQGTGRNQVVRMHIITHGTTNIQLKIDPSVVLATRQYVDQSLRNINVFTHLSASRALESSELGVVLVDAQAMPVTVHLPCADAALGTRDVIVRRTDNSVHRLVVSASGQDRLKFHTHLNFRGYPFLVLMGAGDWWHLRSDGAGGWWPIGRFDSTPLGRPIFETTTLFNPGGYGPLSGQLLKRGDWPWLWDHAQQSGMLRDDYPRYHFEGCWTSGDKISTFRVPDVRGEFLRTLDESRFVDQTMFQGDTTAGSTVIQIYRRSHLLAAGMRIFGEDWTQGNKILSVEGDVITVEIPAEETGTYKWKVAGRMAGSWESDEFGKHTHSVSFGRGTGSLLSLVPETLDAGSASLHPTRSKHTSPPYIDYSGDAETRPRNIAYPGRLKVI